MRRTVTNCLKNCPGRSRNLLTEILAGAGGHSSPEAILRTHATLPYVPTTTRLVNNGDDGIREDTNVE
ncbi:uncharacterized protein LACBIDRAFT_299817 [Laccaria bicolor S238N-H82]|uniref:Predicted protein n=1 Tax=Laccaria bicolor (strain S238N-H82 / ATCC MYA-4686) TaxID=486041 RepID=B0DFH7_LACBS|nr:uncharacterized protein LACBIDRAFT_299817 [Laccaria bicolor S238N-H82]EDR06708.1 predicted protein [Laccaria bicolor S238N-H82]|eukprot:XP_001882555.1 predicted protein [Laccaria bicolor S238N-H82]